jgi:hypothetical protein
VTTRPGLADTLAALRNAGFVHSLLTLATSSYAETVLRATGLRDYFEKVEGHGQRGKGDVEGVAKDFGIPQTEVSSRMLFVGDRMIFDEPRDPNVVFHLETFALKRPASVFERLVLHLRTAGNGSLRQGFQSLGMRDRKWYRLWRRGRVPVGKPARKSIEGIGDLLLLERSDECPVIAFESVPLPVPSPVEHCFVPARIALQ